MRNKSIILAEIVELSEIKSAYNYYLASNRSLSEVENTTQVRKNRDIISAAINELYSELKNVNTVQHSAEQPASVVHNPAEKIAIQMFNHDRRFSITE